MCYNNKLKRRKNTETAFNSYSNGYYFFIVCFDLGVSVIICLFNRLEKLASGDEYSDICFKHGNIFYCTV